MKNILLMVVLGLVACACGFGLLVLADQQGWIGAESSALVAEGNLCPHDLAEERCPFCRPELVDELGWCAGHDVPEAYCTRCNPDVIPAFKASNDWCAEHGLPESQCAQCADAAAPQLPDLTLAVSSEPAAMRADRAPSSTCATIRNTVQLASAQIARRAGLRVEPVRLETIDESVACNAEVAFDGNRSAHLASRAPGIIHEVRVDLGQRVEVGQVLAVVDSSELGSAKASLLQARSLVNLWERNHARDQSLFEENITTEKILLEGEAHLVEARVALSGAEQRLRNLGLSDDEIAGIAADNDTASLLSLRAPFTGVIIERDAVAGEVITTAQPLFKVADMETMWVMLDVEERDVARLAAGQRVSMSFDATPGRSFEGELTWISAQVNPQTRTIRARAEVDNDSGVLRANMFGRASVQVRRIENAHLVPESAVQWEGCCNVVFVRHTDTIYQPYQVTLGQKRGGYVAIEGGPPAGEQVVTQGSFLLKTEILKGNIGAGCCETDPGAAR